METFSALLAICAGNSPVTGEFPAQRPMTRSFDVFFDVRLIKRLSKHSRGWWFETLSHPLWRHRNGLVNALLLLFRFPWRNPSWRSFTPCQPNATVGEVSVFLDSFLFAVPVVQWEFSTQYHNSQSEYVLCKSVKQSFQQRSQRR